MSSTDITGDCSVSNERGGMFPLGRYPVCSVGDDVHLNAPQSFATIDSGDNSFMLVAVTEVASCDDTSDDTFSGGQLATVRESRIFRHPPCTENWSLGDICLDCDELGLLASCSFESFDPQIVKFFMSLWPSQQSKYRR